MTTLTVLSPRAAPRSPTAAPHPSTLQDHLLAFLNANNPRGFSGDELGEVMVFLRDFGSLAECDVQTFKANAVALKMMTNKRIRSMRAHETLSRLFGYRTWTDCLAASHLNDGRFKNLRYGFEIDIPAIQEGEDHDSLAVVTGAHAVLRQTREGQSAKFKHQKFLGVVTSEAANWEGFTTGQLMDLPFQFSRQFYFGHLEPKRERFEAIALVRFFGLEDRQSLFHYRKQRNFPPLFHPDRVLRREHQLARTMANLSHSWTAMSAFVELRRWCMDTAMQARLEETIGNLAGGDPATPVKFVTREYGSVTLLFGNAAGLALITKDERLAHLVVMHKTIDSIKEK